MGRRRSSECSKRRAGRLRVERPAPRGPAGRRPGAKEGDEKVRMATRRAGPGLKPAYLCATYRGLKPAATPKNARSRVFQQPLKPPEFHEHIRGEAHPGLKPSATSLGLPTPR